MVFLSGAKGHWGECPNMGLGQCKAQRGVEV